MSNSMPRFDFWRQFTLLPIWKMAALIYGVDPRDLGDIVDRDGHGIDLSDEEEMLKSAVLTQDILSIPTNNAAPNQYTVISVSSTLPWLRRIGLSALADEFDTTQSPIVQAATAQTAVTQQQAITAANEIEKPLINWRHRVQEEAWEHWLQLRASGGNPTVHSICDFIAKWCTDQDIKGGKGQNPRAGTLRNTVLGAGHWTPPPHSVEEAKKHIAQIEQTSQTKVAQTAQ
jgi:hypothetical protein